MYICIVYLCQAMHKIIITSPASYADQARSTYDLGGYLHYITQYNCIHG